MKLSNLAMIEFTPLVLAVIGAWIICLSIHEFSHALVAYYGGDTSVREKGYLSLDPSRYVDPVGTLLIPTIFLLLGGLPLMGGSVLIDRSRLKSEKWMRIVSAAGPAGNFVLFLLFSLPLHPSIGWLQIGGDGDGSAAEFCGAMAFLNLFSVLFNLIPLPPFDGFGLVEHRFSYETRLMMRQNSMFILVGVFFFFWVTNVAWVPFLWMMESICGVFGIDFSTISQGWVFIFEAR